MRRVRTLSRRPRQPNRYLAPPILQISQVIDIDGMSSPGASVHALSLDTAVGVKARAWHDRFVIRNMIDLQAAADTFSYVDIRNLARRHEPDLDLETVLEHFADVSVFPAEDSTEYGLNAVPSRGQSDSGQCHYRDRTHRT